MCIKTERIVNMRSLKELEGMFEYQTGDCVEYGTYVCAACDGAEPHIAEITHDGDPLPDCPICGGPSYWVKC